MSEYLFNAEQQAVVEAAEGCHLVLAPPGCGKTAVLAERIAWAKKQGADFAEMACLTFTNRAARSMRERIYERLPEADGLEQLFVGNVHRFCSRFLFEHGVVPEHTTVIDTDTSISIIADYLGEDELKVLAETKYRQRYSQVINLQHLMYQCVNHYPAALIVHRDAIKPAALRELCLAFSLPYTQDSSIRLYNQAADYVDEPVPLSPDAKSLMLSLYAARKYEEYKRQNDLLDFEDLLLVTYNATTHDSAFRPFTWLQIDEVQDLNPLQIAIVDRFTAPGANVVYLGDAQQAIFSFMGAQTDTLAQLSKRCEGSHFHNFYQNYRSPQYLLDVFNTYGEQLLNIAPELLPSTTNKTPKQQGDIVLAELQTAADEVAFVAKAVKKLYKQYPDESIAVVVAFNSDADNVSAALGKLPHFKISGTDFFTTPPMRLLLAHLGVVAIDYNFIAWAQLLVGLQVYSTNSSARQAVRSMMQLAMTPADLLCYDNSTYTAEYVRTYEQQDIVVFDTETTGLNVFDDDVVQIAAVRTRQGRVVDELNIFVETKRAIPPMLGDVRNPLVDEYRQHPHLRHHEALKRFCLFAHGAAILGHNATYDYQIMEHNMRRYAPELSMQHEWPVYIDTLKLAHLLHPRQKSYKLRDLLVQLSLEGQNSHLANDDILATLSLAVHCYDCARSMTGHQLAFISSHRKTFDRFRNLYADLYHRTVAKLYETDDKLPAGMEQDTLFQKPALCRALLEADNYLRSIGKLPQLPKLKYLLNYIEGELLTPASGQSLAEQLSRHYTDLTTLKEADFCSAASIDERVFVSTVHKAKGLEFDTVFVFGAVEGRFPSIYANTDDGTQEEARKFYVALSRARRRLVISYSHLSVSRWGKTFTNRLTPFMAPIAHLFEHYKE